MTLYLDVDGTLAFGQSPNYALVNAVKRFSNAHPTTSVVVWSAAGEAHARAWRDKLLPFASVQKKHLAGVQPPDIAVDNMKWPGVLKPAEFTRMYK